MPTSLLHATGIEAGENFLVRILDDGRISAMRTGLEVRDAGIADLFVLNVFEQIFDEIGLQHRPEHAHVKFERTLLLDTIERVLAVADRHLRIAFNAALAISVSTRTRKHVLAEQLVVEATLALDQLTLLFGCFQFG